MIKQEIKSLTALRGIAAMLIVAHHVTLLMLPFRGTAYAEPFQHMGNLGMSLFFCLSGFVIFYNYSSTVLSKKGVRNFIAARLSRLLPLYVLFVIINFFYNYKLSGAANNFDFLQALPINILGVQSWFYGHIDGMPLESSQLYANLAWSISTELMLYILFIPSAFFIYKFKPGFSRGCTILLIGIAGRCIFVLCSSGQFVSNIDAEFSHWLIYTSPYGRFFEFLAGVGVADLWICGCLNSRVFKVVCICSLAYVSLSIFTINGTAYRSIFVGDMIYIGYALCVPFIIAFFCIAERKHELEYGPLLVVGELSYSVYLIHGDLYPLFRSGWELAATNVVSFCVTLAFISYFSYKHIELPGKKILLKTLSSK